MDTDSPNHWPGRAYFQAVTKGDEVYVLGGQNFNVLNNPDPAGPPLITVSDFFNDVWRTQDGIAWDLVTNAADWVARPGHQAVVVEDEIVMFGGFGLSTDPNEPFKPSNPMDMWTSEDGANWELLDQVPWNAQSAGQIKYDFDALVAPTGLEGANAIFTFGGDRETFNPFDPVNYLNVDNDVWTFTPVPEPSSFLLGMLGLIGFCPIARRRLRNPVL